MADVFVSYSRSDAEFVSRLAEDLKQRGKEVWVDVDGVRDAEVFPQALRRAIEGSDAFVFVISPESVGSEFCEQEVTHASALNKRIVPLALRPVPDEQIPEEIRWRNWIPVGEQTGVERVLAAIETDLEWEQQHTRIMLRALQWEQAGRDGSVLLRGSELADAERWLAAGAGKDPGPTALEQEYLLAARQGASRRQRVITAAVSGMLVVALGLLVFALISRANAVSAESSADAQRLAALSETQLPLDPERAVLLAIAAVRERATYGPSGTMFALRAALDASTIRYRLPPAGDQSCGAFNPVFDPSPGSNLVAASLCDGKVRFLDARTGRLERVVTLGSPKSPPYLGYGFAGHRAVLVGFGGGGRLVVLDPTTGAVIKRGPTIPVANEALVTPDYANAPLVAAYGRASPGDRGVFVVWNYRTGRAIWLHPPLPMAYAYVFSFAGSGTVAITFSGAPSGIGLALYDYVHRRVLATRQDTATNVVQSPDGRTLAVGLTRADGSGTIELVNAQTLAPTPGFRPPTLPQGVTYALAFSRDGRFLAYGLLDGSAGVLDASTGAAVNTYAGAPDFVSWVAISPDDRLLLTSSPDGTGQAYRLGGRALRTFPRVGMPDQFLQLSPVEGGFEAIASPGPRPGEGIVVERYTDAGRAVDSPLVISHQAGWLDASLSPDGTLATDAPGNPSSAKSAPMSEWSVPGRRIERTIIFPNGPGGASVISPTDKLLVTGPGPPCCFQTPGPKPVMLIDLRTGRRRTLPASTTSCTWQAFAFSRTGAAVAAGDQCGKEGVWDTVTGRSLGHPIQIPGNASSLAFSPDGRSLAIASSNGTVYIARVPLTPATRPLHASTQSVQSVAYSSDGRYLAAVGLDRTAHIYDARSLTELRVIQLPQAGQGVAFTTDSRDLLTWDATGTVTLWDACTDCESPSSLLSLARTRVTRSLTAAERREFNVR